jgi:cytochrome oxidase Cu insertion factor (SCO1/SenC/PrrC family)
MRLSRPTRLALVAAALLVGGAARDARAQQQPAAAPADVGPKVGEMAPDFALPGATRYGTLAKPVRLSDFRGQSVIIAFFPVARSRG